MDTSRSTQSLVDLAACKQLPRHQYIDQATVSWIEANRPNFTTGPVPRPRPASQRLLRRSGIPVAWWGEDRVQMSLHGLRHGMRTAALAAVLAEENELEEDEAADLILAAAVHDCRRLHDKEDRGHGARAALWLTENADAVWGHFHQAATPARIDRAATAVRLHDVPYTAFSADDEGDHSRNAQVCDLLKTADALDRYRLPKLSWWPDPAHVRAEAFDRLRATAFDLVVRSETGHLAGLESAEAVFEALVHRELLS